MLNHDHFFQICEAISKKNVRLQRKLAKSGGALNTEQGTSTDEVNHRNLVKEVTRLLNNEDEGIESIEDDQEMIAMLNADILLESNDPESRRIALDYG